VLLRELGQVSEFRRRGQARIYLQTMDRLAGEEQQAGAGRAGET
jgi:hypothetical protein